MWLYGPYIGLVALLALTAGVVALAHHERPRS